MPKKANTLNSAFIIADFENILAPEDNGKQDPEKSFTNKYQKHITFNYGYKSVCIDDNFSKRFKSYLGKDVLYNFTNSMIEEIRYCSDAMKKHFNKELVMTKEGNKGFKDSTKCWVCDNGYIDNGAKEEIVISVLN